MRGKNAEREQKGDIKLVGFDCEGPSEGRYLQFSSLAIIAFKIYE